jgi:hypothetical protein
VQDNTVTLEAVPALANNLGDTLIEGVTEGNVSNDTTLEESPWANTLGAINNLVRNDKVARLDLLLETANSGEGNDATDANGTEGSNIGAGRDLMGSDLVVGAVAAQKGNGNDLAIVLALVVQNGDGRGGVAPGG